MGRLLPTAVICLLIASGCQGENPRRPEPGGADAEVPAPDPGGEERVVVLRTGPLHLEPAVGSPGVTDVLAGTLLSIAPDPAAPAPDGWLRLATWDDRRGWMPVSRLMDAALWSDYGRALGGVSPALLRPAYPAEGGRWAVEAPLGSPGFTSASTGWLLGDSARAVRIVSIDSVENICGGERHRFGVLDLAAEADHYPLLEGGLLATPSGTRPEARRLEVGSFEPDSALAGLARAAAREFGPSPGSAPTEIGWTAIGDAAAWAALSWPAEDPETGQAQLAAALVFRRTGGGWEQASTLGPAASSAEIPTPAWRPVAAYATGPEGLPTLLLLETFEYEGAHLDLWIERGTGFERMYEGYYWGC